MSLYHISACNSHFYPIALGMSVEPKLTTEMHMSAGQAHRAPVATAAQSDY